MKPQKPQKPDIQAIARAVTDDAMAGLDFELYRYVEAALTAMWLDGVRFGRTGASTASELAPKPNKPKVKRMKT